jgi:hypothetical protein
MAILALFMAGDQSYDLSNSTENTNWNNKPVTEGILKTVKLEE